MSTTGTPVYHRLTTRPQMPRTRLHVDGPLIANSKLDLEGNAVRYIGRVLRLAPNDELTLFDGRGGEYRATIQSISKNKVQVSIADHIDRDVESPLAIHLLQGISRGERMDIVVQKATELGAQTITPVITDHSVVKLDTGAASRRVPVSNAAETRFPRSNRRRPFAPGWARMSIHREPGSFCDPARPRRSGRWTSFCDPARPRRSGRWTSRIGR
jgi:hypothetical protein